MVRVGAGFDAGELALAGDGLVAGADADTGLPAGLPVARLLGWAPAAGPEAIACPSWEAAAAGRVGVTAVAVAAGPGAAPVPAAVVAPAVGMAVALAVTVAVAGASAPAPGLAATAAVSVPVPAVGAGAGPPAAYWMSAARSELVVAPEVGEAIAPRVALPPTSCGLPAIGAGALAESALASRGAAVLPAAGRTGVAGTVAPLASAAEAAALGSAAAGVEGGLVAAAVRAPRPLPAALWGKPDDGVLFRWSPAVAICFVWPSATAVRAT